jgi:hypothetical protein
LAELWSRGARTRWNCINGGGICSVEQIEELEVGPELDAFSKIEPFGHARVHVDESGAGEVISPLREINTVKVVVAIDVRRICRKGGAIVKSALRAKDAAEKRL